MCSKKEPSNSKRRRTASAPATPAPAAEPGQSIVDHSKLLTPGSKSAFLLSILAVWRFAQREKAQTHAHTAAPAADAEPPRSPTAFMLDP